MIFQEYHKTVLPNGLTVISEHISTVRSVSLGGWIKSGSRQESREINGVAHFLEHMMFKGTSHRTPREIVRSVEALGGNINAFTSKEQTCFYVEVLDEHLSQAVEVLADIVCHSTFPQAEMEKEREVILDEIQSLEESPDELILDYFVEHLFPEHQLGMPIIGTRETVRNISRDQLIHFYQQHYRSSNIIVAAAGNVDHQELVELCQRYFLFPHRNGVYRTTTPEQSSQGEYVFQKPIQQCHICMGISGVSFSDPRKYSLLLINTILGTGMGSRLFQNIREAHGLAYGIFSFVDFYLDGGVFGTYLATDPKKQHLAIQLLEQEFQKLQKEPLSQEELEEAKSQLKGNLVLALESTASRMNRLAMMEIYLGSFLPIDEITQQIDNITIDEISQTAQELLDVSRMLRIIFIPHK
ncbi:MAG: insulinase family protein [Calditrichaeota bacterium]|nr:MAG: insulinase family protein [Calditrichota bacterium]